MRLTYLLPLALLLLLLIPSSPAMASCTDISVGADIIIVGTHTDNRDFDESALDSLGRYTQYTSIYLFNTYTDKVRTVMRIDGLVRDAAKPSLSIDRAYIEMTEFLGESVTLRVGKLSLIWQLRRLFGSGAFYQLAFGSMESGFVFKAKPLGFDINYKPNPQVSVTAGWGKIKEASLPTNNDNDLDVLFLRYDQSYGAKNRLFAAFLFYSDRYEPTPATNTLTGDLWYLNLGVDHFVLEESLELYFELAWQGGDPHDPTRDFGALAFDLGAEWTFADIQTVPYLGLEVNWFQGADGSTYGYQRVNTNWNRTLVAESDYLGRAWNRPGYLGIKLMAGMKSINDGEFGLDIILGLFKADGDLPAGTGNGLGVEADILAAWFYNEDVTFSAGLGYFDPDEDLAGPDPDAALTLIWGANIIF